MRSFAIIFSVLLVLFSFHHAQARIIHVPAEQTTIQAGINASVNGDTVLVAQWTYYEHINFNGHNILLGSLFLTSGDTSYISNTIIDGSSSGIVITVANGEDNAAQVVGFTVQYGRPNNFGGGIFCNNSSSPTIRNNLLRKNLAYDGGAICCQNSSSPLIENNNIIENIADNLAGGIFCYEGCSPIIRNNLFNGNKAHDGASVFCLSYCSPTIKSNLFTCDTATAWGTIFCEDNSSPLLLNNTIDMCFSVSGILISNTASSPIIKNTIISNCTGYGVYAVGGTNPLITYSDVWNNSPGNFLGCVPGSGCISADPLFCDTSIDNYHLHAFSPCLGSGQGGADIGAFRSGCGRMVLLSTGPEQQGRALTDVLVAFYVVNFSTNDTFNLDVTDSLGWSIIPTHYDVPLGSEETDTVSFTVSIPYVMVGTKDKLTLVAVSQSDPPFSDTASLFVYCDEFAEGVEITSEGDTSGYADSMVSVAFWVQNTGVITDSYSVDISNTLGWTINPLHFDLTLDTAEVDSVSFTVNIPYVPLGTTDQLTLYGISKTNPFVLDSASLVVTCNAYVEDWNITSGNDLTVRANTQVTAYFYIQNSGLAPDSCNLTIADSLGWSIQPPSYRRLLDPGQMDTILFEIQVPYVPVGTTNRLILSGVSLTNPYALDSSSLNITCTSRIINVPANFSKIQTAINFSSDGDSIIVAPGTYYEHINFHSKGVVVKSEKGRDSTTISKIAGGVSMVYFINGEDSSSVLEGFTITEGNLETGQGAGIRCWNTSPKILNNRIVNNSCPLGAGIDCDYHSSPLIANNLIEINTATSQGGGIRCNNYSSPVISDNVIVRNSAGESGAGILCLLYCSPTITGNKIMGNAAQNSGGGILFDGHCSPTITGNLIAYDSAKTGYGGGIGLLNSSIANITDNTIDKNPAWKGGGIFFDNSSTGSVLNTIVTNTPAGKGIRAEGPFPTVIYCDVWNNLNENYYGCVPGDGCISADPLFCNPNNNDYSLWVSSPCLGSGQGGANIGAFGVGCSTVGDANGDGVIDLGDVVLLITYLYKNGPAPNPLLAGDANCSGEVELGDVVYLITYLYKNGPPPSC